MALNINNINNQDLNKEIITPEGKSSSIKDQVAEQLKNKAKAKEVPEEKPVQNILVNAESKAKKAWKKEYKDTEKAAKAWAEAKNAVGTEKAEKANIKAANKINKARESHDKAVDAEFMARGEREAKEQEKKDKELKKYGFTLKDDGSDEGYWVFDMNVAKKTIENSLRINTIVDNIIKIYELAKETGDEAIVEDATKQLKDYYDKKASDKSIMKNAIKRDIDIVASRIQEKNPELYNALWGSSTTDNANVKDNKASVVTPEQVAKALQESKTEKAEETPAEKKAREAANKDTTSTATVTKKSNTTKSENKPVVKAENKPEEKDPLSTANRARSIILEGNETAEDIRDKAKKQITLDTDLTNERLEKKENAAKLRDFLPHFAISRYLNNEFGNIKKDKYGNPLNPAEKKQADRTLAYFILDKIGAGLINSSNMMNGLAPSQKTALQKYNETQMDNALKRDDSVRAKIYTEQLNNIVKDDDTFRQLGITQVTFVDNTLSRALEQNIDNVNKTQALKILKEQAAFLNTLPEKEKNLMVQAIMLQTTGDSAMKILGKQWQLEIMKNNKATEADIAKADYDVANYGALKLYANNTAKVNYNKLEQEYENLKAQGKLTNAQVNDIMTQVQLHQKDIDWYNANATLKQISGYTGIATGVLNSAAGFIDALKPW